MHDARKGATLNRVIPWLALFVALVVVPGLNLMSSEQSPLLSIETVARLGRFLCFAIVAIGIDLIWGYTGILSLCQAMFFCLGGYCMGMYLAHHGPLDGDNIPRCLFVVSSDVGGFSLPWFWKPFESFPLAIFFGMLVPGAVAFILGWLAFRSRVRGVYFSIITQAATLAVWNIFCLNQMRLCGTNGLTNFTHILGFELREPHVKLGLYVVTVIVLAVVYFLCRALIHSRMGRILVAIRDNESRLRFSGYQPLYFKLFIFTLAAVIAAIGGMLYTPQMGIITPFNMSVEQSITLVVMVAVGGRGKLAGAVVGALLLNYLYDYLTSYAPTLWPFALGGLAIGVVLYFPEGVVGLWQRFFGGAEEGAVPILPADPAARIETSEAPASAAPIAVAGEKAGT